MQKRPFQCLLAITALAFGADAAADASAQPPAQQATAGQTTAEQQSAAELAAAEEAASLPHAKILGAVHAQGNVYRQQPQQPQPTKPLSQQPRQAQQRQTQQQPAATDPNFIGTLAECFTLANGWMQNADLTRVHILRAADEARNADTPPTLVNFRLYLERGNRSANVPIYAGDTIFVPELGTTATETVQNIRLIEERYVQYPTPRSTVYVITPPSKPHPRPNPHHPPHRPPQPPRPPRPQPEVKPQPAPQQPRKVQAVRVYPGQPQRQHPAGSIPAAGSK